MSEIEAESCLVTCFSQALKHGMLNKYNDGERKFLSLYQALAIDGVACNRPGLPRLIHCDDPQLEAIFVDSLREKRFMDIYFLSAGVRVIGR
jgi:hypothetical protein